MVRSAAEKAGIDGLDEFLVGPTAVATSTEDVAPKLSQDLQRTSSIRN